MSDSFDWGLGTTNIDLETGIRYGVIHSGELGQYWYDEAEPDYGPPTCGWCGSEDVTEDETKPYAETWSCADCGRNDSNDAIWGDTPIAFTYEGDGYVMQQGGDDHDIFVIASPYYTLCSFCSPCAPGAGYLLDSSEDGIKAYCPGHDWYESGIAPYPVYRVSDDTLVIPETTTTNSVESE